MAIASDTAPVVTPSGATASFQAWRMFVPLLVVFGLALVIPFIGDDYWVLIASRAAIYWVLSLAFEQLQRRAERRLNRAHLQH